MKLNATMALAILITIAIIGLVSLGFFTFTFVQVIKAKGEPINFYQDKLK